MNAVETIKTVCKERKIPISTLEKNCGFANGYIGQLKKGTMPADRLKKVCDYLVLDMDDVLGIKKYKYDKKNNTLESIISPKDMSLFIEVMSDSDSAQRMITYAKKLLELKQMENI